MGNALPNSNSDRDLLYMEADGGVLMSQLGSHFRYGRWP